MSAKYCLRPGKFLVFAWIGYGNESESTVPFVMVGYFCRVSSLNDPGLPPSGIFALSCAIAPISCVVTASVWEISTASGFSCWICAMYGA